MRALVMETLSLPINTLNNNSSANYISLSSTSNYASFSSLQFRSSFTTRTLNLRVVRVQAESEDGELKQMRDMAAARKRWEALIRDGKVKVLTPKEAGYAVQLSNKPLLDVRPSNEHNKAWVRASTWIPIFDVDNRLDAGTIPKKVSNFVMGGWWSGMPTLSYNSQFLAKVSEKFSEDTELIVACQKGLRSLAACELLYNAGYQNLFWVQGGLEAAEDQDLAVEGPVPLKFAGIGGVSEFLGWTDQQRAAGAKEGWGYSFVFSARLLGVFIAADALYIGAQQIGRYLQDIRTH
ncbi:putative Rhodanese-like domain-containing protein [Lupinus albus]|uniref:Putative Rhodanese-like domain-containing protein n=1 Tax=Lupinus albus TaxID=3870 RepID=A0A6A4PRR1_LUPAL|nr:putative Rhodanese-like domain-containing protein [Lupinus albus]